MSDQEQTSTRNVTAAVVLITLTVVMGVVVVILFAEKVSAKSSGSSDDISEGGTINGTLNLSNNNLIGISELEVAGGSSTVNTMSVKGEIKGESLTAGNLSSATITTANTLSSGVTKLNSIEVGDNLYQLPVSVGLPSQFLSVTADGKHLEFSTAHSNRWIEVKTAPPPNSVVTFADTGGQNVTATPVTLSATGGMLGITNLNGVSLSTLAAQGTAAMPNKGASQLVVGTANPMTLSQSGLQSQGSLAVTSLGNVNITSAAANASSGNVNISSGTGRDLSGNVTVSTGNATSKSGDITAYSGDGTNTSGDLQILSGESASKSGDINITTGDGGISGNITVKAGVSEEGPGPGGSILFDTGANGLVRWTTTAIAPDIGDLAFGGLGMCYPLRQYTAGPITSEPLQFYNLTAPVSGEIPTPTLTGEDQVGYVRILNIGLANNLTISGSCLIDTADIVIVPGKGTVFMFLPSPILKWVATELTA